MEIKYSFSYSLHSSIKESEFWLFLDIEIGSKVVESLNVSQASDSWV